jgi:hypothetical protein
MLEPCSWPEEPDSEHDSDRILYQLMRHHVRDHWIRSEEHSRHKRMSHPGARVGFSRRREHGAFGRGAVEICKQRRQETSILALKMHSESS